MDFLIIVIIAYLLFFQVPIVWRFIEYKKLEKSYKKEIYEYLYRRGLSLSGSLEMAFSNLNESKNIKLDHSIVFVVAREISNLNKIMSVENVIEIYSQFIYRYIFNNGKDKKPKEISKEKLIYALDNIDFDNYNGYFVIKPDKGDDFDKKYS